VTVIELIELLEAYNADAEVIVTAGMFGMAYDITEEEYDEDTNSVILFTK
jgi:hypothetical protein